MTASSEHSHSANTSIRKSVQLKASLLITLIFVIVEIITGLLSNSLALLTDAAHNITDVMALALSWYAVQLSLRPANVRRTFGYHRAGILVALANSSTLVVISIGIFIEAYHRLKNPIQVDSEILIGVSLIAVIVNGVTAWLVHRGSDKDLNLRSAYIHLVGDVISTIGAFAAGIAIFLTGWNWLDPLVSVLIGGLILWNAWRILRETAAILLEGVPVDIDIHELVEEIKRIPGVFGVHDLHVWSITQEMRNLSAHLVTQDIPISEGALIQENVSRMLLIRFQIAHATLQLECEDCNMGPLFCDLTINNQDLGATGIQDNQ